MKGISGEGKRSTTLLLLALALCLSVGINAAQAINGKETRMQLAMERRRDMTDVVRAMADIEVNLQKLLIASGASQSVELLGETALLAQHVETGLSRLPLDAEAATGAMKFAGQMGDYTMTLAAQVSGGAMLTRDDERQIEDMLSACQGLNTHLMNVGEQLYEKPIELHEEGAPGWQEAAIGGDGAIEYPSLIYDGPFSDGRQADAPKGLIGTRIAREQAREIAARFAGTAADCVRDAADSGGMFEAFGFVADTDSGRISVQITGQGGHLLWMMPEQAEYEAQISKEACEESAAQWLEKMGYGDMERCFTQIYDGMAVMNFAAVQDGVLLYPDQVKLQVSMENGAVVGAECSQYLMNHIGRENLVPVLSVEEAQEALSNRLEISGGRLCVIPTDCGERLCWGFEGTFAGARYAVFVDADTGESTDILRIDMTQEGELAV